MLASLLALSFPFASTAELSLFLFLACYCYVCFSHSLSESALVRHPDHPFPLLPPSLPTVAAAANRAPVVAEQPLYLQPLYSPTILEYLGYSRVRGTDSKRREGEREKYPHSLLRFRAVFLSHTHDSSFRFRTETKRKRERARIRLDALKREEQFIVLCIALTQIDIRIYLRSRGQNLKRPNVNGAIVWDFKIRNIKIRGNGSTPSTSTLEILS